jgi:hypothetical protein
MELSLVAVAAQGQDAGQASADALSRSALLSAEYLSADSNTMSSWQSVAATTHARSRAAPIRPHSAEYDEE